MEKILIVEDESIVALELKSRLTDLGYSICGIVASGNEAIRLTNEQKPNIILMDINIKGSLDGVETAEKIKGIYDIPIIFLTAFADSSTLERAKITQPYGYIIKPFEERELHTSIEIALYKHNMEKRLRDSERRLFITLKSISDAVIATDNDGKINYLNPAAESLTSFSNDEAIGKYVLDVFNINDEVIYQIADSAIKKLITDGYTDSFPGNLTILHKNGEIKIVESSASAIKDENTNIDGIVLVFRDVTEKFKAEAALLESEKKYRKVIENASEVIFTLSIDWKYSYVNSATSRITEYSKEELKEMDFLKLILPSHRNLCKFKLMRQYLSRERTTYIEFPFRSKSGRIVWFAQSNTLIIEDGKVIGYDIIARDITEKKRAENQLNERNEFIETVLKNIQTGVIVCDIKTEEIIYTNNKFVEIFGYAKEDLKSFSQLLEHAIYDDNDYRLSIKQNIFDGIKTHDNSKLKCHGIKISTSKGIKKYIECSIIPLYEQGIIIASIEDITFKKNAEEQILKLSRAVEQSPVSVIITSVEGKIEYVNPKFEDVTGYSYKEVVGENLQILSSSLTLHPEYEKLWNLIQNGNDWIGEFQNKRKNGESYWASVLISPIKDPDGKIAHFLGLEEDITERKKNELELINAKEKAEEMNRLKSVFLANMSHELRTPMVGILGFAQILKDELSDNGDIEMVDLLIKSGKRLLNTLESILEFSQLESKQVYLNLRQINISVRVGNLIKNFNDRLDEKKLKLNLNFINKTINVLADSRLIDQVLNNLIDNAIKFTPKGEISIETNEIIENNKTWGIIKISDTGIGISKEKQNIIFEDFRQASEGKTRSFEGNGLGLTVAKKIVEIMNGFITLESDLGAGSTFTIYLPASIEEKDKHTELPQLEDKKNGKNMFNIQSYDHKPEILLVEDNEMNREVVMIYLKKTCKIDYAKDGMTAVKMASQKRYSVVLMDINLGNGFSGIDAMKKIKSMNGYKNIPFVALTGYALHGDKEKLLEEGCTHYLSKPFMKQDLVDLVTGLINTGSKSSLNKN